MCDYSLHHVKSRPAKVGDKLTTRNFHTGTRGFASPDDRTTAVCILPGTELAFSEGVKWAPFGLLCWRVKVIESTTAARHRPEAPRTDNRRCILTLLSALEPRFTFRGADVVEVLDKPLCADLVRASEEI
jgi:hypothetical protein